MKNFWKDLPKPFFVLAPMEAVTDVVFRHVVANAAAPDLYMTEFTNAASYASEKGIASTRGRLAFTEDEQPIVAQIWGNNPEHFEFMARGLAKKGFAGIDINMGCPDKAVVKQGSGSGLIGCLPEASALIAAAKEGGLPVSVKTRLGSTKIEEWKPWLTHILKQDIVNLTIHLRTRKEMSKVEAHFELIPEIKALRDEVAPNTLLTINGDIRDRQHGEELVAKYGVDGVMIGRGIFTNPFAFAGKRVAARGAAPDFASRLVDERKSGADSPTGPASSDLRANSHGIGNDGSGEHKNKLLSLLNMHLDLHDKYSAELEPRKFEPLKRFFKIYIREFDGASELREKLMHTKNTTEVRSLIN